MANVEREPVFGEKKITLKSSDGKDFIVEEKVAAKSVLIKNMMLHFTNDDDDDDDEDNEERVFPIKNVRAAVLEKVLEWAEHHKDDETPPPDDSDVRKFVPIPEWDKKFLEVDQEMIYEIILAANFLDIGPLLDTGCKVVAEMIRGKTPEQIRKVFNIENDFTPEEEQAIKRENEWAEDR